MRKQITAAGFAGLVILGCAEGPSAPSVHSHEMEPSNAAAPVALNNQELALVRQSTARYQSFNTALDDGFVQLSPCIASQQGRGAMGFHYGMPSRMFDDVIDPATPEILNYAPDNGRMRLGAIEYFVAKAAWDATHASPPSIGGREFDMVPAGAVPGLPAHYSLHIWVWRDNPNGMFDLFNPKVSCDSNI